MLTELIVEGNMIGSRVLGLGERMKEKDKKDRVSGVGKRSHPATSSRLKQIKRGG
jgi:hypothetical protein